MKLKNFHKVVANTSQEVKDKVKAMMDRQEAEAFSYCQRDIEGESMCEKQCDHCKAYYAPLENKD